MPIVVPLAVITVTSRCLFLTFRIKGCFLNFSLITQNLKWDLCMGFLDSNLYEEDPSIIKALIRTNQGYINQLLIGWKRYPTVYTD